MITVGIGGAYDSQRAEFTRTKAETPGPGQASWCPAFSF